MIGGKPAAATKRASGTKRVVTDGKKKGDNGKKESKCAANISTTPLSTATKPTSPTALPATVVPSPKPPSKTSQINSKSVPTKRNSNKERSSTASPSLFPSEGLKKKEEKVGKLPSNGLSRESTISKNAVDAPIVEDLERAESVGGLLPLPRQNRQPQKRQPHPPKQPRDQRSHDGKQHLPSIGDGGDAAVSTREVDAPIVEDLERNDNLVQLLPLPVRGQQRPSSIGGKPKRRNHSGSAVQRSESANSTRWKNNGNDASCNSSVSSATKKSCTCNRKSLSSSPSFCAADEDDIILNDEDDEDDDDEDDEDEDDDFENSSDYDDEDDEDEADDEEEEEEEEDEDGEEEEDEDDVGPRPKRSPHSMEQITVKVSREGDRNVKVMFITKSTKFKSFVKEIMRRFSYSRVRDFDMYCIDAAGDHVDIDVPEDFKSLVRNFLRILQQEHSKNGGKTTGSASTTPGSGSPSLDVTRRFSARETLMGSASLLRTSSPMYVAQPLSDEADRSSSTVLRLYVRDSYRARQKEEKRRMRYSFPHSDGSGQMPLQFQPSSTPPPALLRIQPPLIAPDLTSVDAGSVGPSEMLMRDCSTISAQFNHTVVGLAQTIGFREDEEVQWSRMCLLGKGSSGAVYEGITSEGKIMAVKVQEIPLDEDAEEVKVIQREINLMRSLKHKNIVAYYGCQTKILPNGARELEIFLEHCHGGSLSHLRRKFERAKERFSISLVRTYARQILEGLNYLHSMNVVHRDLKSDNVLISSLGEAKLADFGCSKRIGTATLQQESCGERGAGYQTMVGTPLFMAPEVLNGSDDTNNNTNNNNNNNNNNNTSHDNTSTNKGSSNHGYGKPADIWAVGCLVLELLGRQPWAVKGNANAFQIMYHISKSTGMPTGVPQKCPKSLHSFFTRCFERSPAQRATAEELLQHEWITCPDNQLEEVLPEEE